MSHNLQELGSRKLTVRHLQSRLARAVAAPVGPIMPLTAICFPQHKQVEISIIIPVFNQLDYTQACLASLQDEEEQTRLKSL